MIPFNDKKSGGKERKGKKQKGSWDRKRGRNWDRSNGKATKNTRRMAICPENRKRE